MSLISRTQEMALVPVLTNDISDTINFGMGVSAQELHQSILPTATSRPWAQFRREEASLNAFKTVDNISTAKDGTFQVAVDVHEFTVKDITVKTTDHTIVIEGKHEQRPVEKGTIERHFIRKFILPKEYEPENVQSTLSSDGILLVTVPPRSMADENKESRLDSNPSN